MSINKDLKNVDEIATGPVDGGIVDSIQPQAVILDRRATGLWSFTLGRTGMQSFEPIAEAIGYLTNEEVVRLSRAFHSHSFLTNILEHVLGKRNVREHNRFITVQMLLRAATLHAEVELSSREIQIYVSVLAKFLEQVNLVSDFDGIADVVEHYRLLPQHEDIAADVLKQFILDQLDGERLGEMDRGSLFEQGGQTSPEALGVQMAPSLRKLGVALREGSEVKMRFYSVLDMIRTSLIAPDRFEGDTALLSSATLQTLQGVFNLVTMALDSHRPTHTVSAWDRERALKEVYTHLEKSKRFGFQSLDEVRKMVTVDTVRNQHGALAGGVFSVKRNISADYQVADYPMATENYSYLVPFETLSKRLEGIGEEVLRQLNTDRLVPVAMDLIANAEQPTAAILFDERELLDVCAARAADRVVVVAGNQAEVDPSVAYIKAIPEVAWESPSRLANGDLVTADPRELLMVAGNYEASQELPSRVGKVQFVADGSLVREEAIPKIPTGSRPLKQQFHIGEASIDYATNLQQIFKWEMYGDTYVTINPSAQQEVSGFFEYANALWDLLPSEEDADAESRALRIRTSNAIVHALAEATAGQLPHRALRQMLYDLQKQGHDLPVTRSRALRDHFVVAQMQVYMSALVASRVFGADIKSVSNLLESITTRDAFVMMVGNSTLFSPSESISS